MASRRWANGIAPQAKVNASTSGSVLIDSRPGEAFKPVFLSSMRVSDTQWDARAAVVDGMNAAIPTQGWLIPPAPPVMATTFGFTGGTSTWKTNAPTIKIEMTGPIQVAGWVTASSDPNDDNLGLWAATKQALSAWEYTATAEWAGPAGPIYLPIVNK